MTITPVVSVAMVTYNHSAFIAEAINGVAMQKANFPIELVIGVDQSSDNTLEIVQDYQKRYPHLIRALMPETRLGAHQNFNQVVRACRGTYIAICEGDDYWINPMKLEKQVAVLEHDPTVAGVFHDCTIWRSSVGHQPSRIGNRQIDRRPDVPSLIRELNIATCSMVFRNLVPWQRTDRLIAQVAQGDYLLALLVAQHGVWSYLDEAMAVYRVHDGGMWSGMRDVQRWVNNVKFWELLECFYGSSSFLDLIKARKRNASRGLSMALAREGRVLKSFNAYLRSLGPRRVLRGRYFFSSQYFKVLARSLASRFGLREGLP